MGVTEGVEGEGGDEWLSPTGAGTVVLTVGETTGASFFSFAVEGERGLRMWSGAVLGAFFPGHFADK